MSKYAEETLNRWSKPASETEEKRISSAIKMIKEAIDNYDNLKDKNIEVFVQGSYVNNTNVKTKSDVDVCVMLKDIFYSEYPNGYNKEHYGFIEATSSFDDFKKNVINALKKKYGDENIKPGNKSIKMESTSHRVEADAVPAFQYRNYKIINSTDENSFVEGIKFYSSTQDEVINYPKKHIENGKNKNTATQRRYKRTARIFKRIRHQMIQDNIPVKKCISSFLIESLLFNVDNFQFIYDKPWNNKIKDIIKYLYDDDKSNYTEVSEKLNLFDDTRKWDIDSVDNFLKQMYNFLGYNS
ncbi:MAG: Nucleotidyltransferase [uncultured Campylobacterales bacterium]|uniref:Nucleotidyltransferase n=1 Tax=uncultured Campylobacterales bacterium TaxID=352960 RepID=A0A6S6SVX0_9BACT|nr:MAG: Nucleotidyltransferase [uncultured Campylobacterales bacterium]